MQSELTVDSVVIPVIMNHTGNINQLIFQSW